MQSSMLRLPVLHTGMRQLLLCKTSCRGLPVGLGRGSGLSMHAMWALPW